MGLATTCLGILGVAALTLQAHAETETKHQEVYIECPKLMMTAAGIVAPPEDWEQLNIPAASREPVTLRPSGTQIEGDGVITVTCTGDVPPNYEGTEKLVILKRRYVPRHSFKEIKRDGRIKTKRTDSVYTDCTAELAKTIRLSPRSVVKRDVFTCKETVTIEIKDKTSNQ